MSMCSALQLAFEVLILIVSGPSHLVPYSLCSLLKWAASRVTPRVDIGDTQLFHWHIRAVFSFVI